MTHMTDDMLERPSFVDDSGTSARYVPVTCNFQLLPKVLSFDRLHNVLPQHFGRRAESSDICVFEAWPLEDRVDQFRG